ncbi:PTS glucose transporter subunit IIA, partial [Brevibacillus sp. SIMBA_076]
MEGDVIPLEQVADSVFSEKMMGDGIAITPTDG